MNPWELRPWEHLTDRFDIVCLLSQSNRFDASLLRVRTQGARTARDLLPKGRLGDLAVRVPGDRYLGLASQLRGADIVHSQELGYWYSMQAARLKPRLGYKLVLTVWETLPFIRSYRNIRTRRYRRLVLPRTDFFLPATERARLALLLEGAAASKIRVSPPGVDAERFTPRADLPAPSEHVILSPGRLVWEKGHQDVLRAAAALRRGIVRGPATTGEGPRVVIVGTGPEERRLRNYARELGIADRAEFRSFIPYEEMPSVYAEASCLVLASLPIWSWEEQFGMVLAEALNARLPILASASGAIPEVVGESATLFAPGDWIGLARALAEGPLARPPGTRADGRPALADTYSSTEAAERLAVIYGELVSG